MKRLGKNDLIDWLHNPVTIAYLAGVADKIREIEIEAGNGSIVNHENPSYTASRLVEYTGRIQGLNDALEVSKDFVNVEDLIDET